MNNPWPTWEEIQKRTRTLRTRTERVDYLLTATDKELYDAVTGYLAGRMHAKRKPYWVRAYIFELRERGLVP